jgi:hypothetical protein
VFFQVLSRILPIFLTLVAVPDTLHIFLEVGKNTRFAKYNLANSWRCSYCTALESLFSLI